MGLFDPSSSEIALTGKASSSPCCERTLAAVPLRVSATSARGSPLRLSPSMTPDAVDELGPLRDAVCVLLLSQFLHDHIAKIKQDRT